MLNKIFKSAKAEELKIFEKISQLEEKKKGDILFLEGDSPDFVYFLINGVVKIYKTTANNGKEVTLNYILPKAFVGEFAVFKRIDFPFSAEMETDGEILKFRSDEFLVL